MISPALTEASTDKALHGAHVRLLMYLHGLLIPGEYRTLKLWPVAHEIHMNKSTVSKAISLLVRRGYLREGPRQEAGVRCFMLVPVRGEPSRKSEQSPGST